MDGDELREWLQGLTIDELEEEVADLQMHADLGYRAAARLRDTIARAHHYLTSGDTDAATRILGRHVDSLSEADEHAEYEAHLQDDPPRTPSGQLRLVSTD